MKIYVVSRKFIKMFSANDSFFLRNNFISIGEVEGYEGVPVAGDNVLKLVFDDASDNEGNVNLFTDKHADRIKEFAERIDKSKTLYINCQATISRSGAVGTVLNDYFNLFLQDCKRTKDWYDFFADNRQIQPNAYVMRILRKTMGLV